MSIARSMRLALLTAVLLVAGLVGASPALALSDWWSGTISVDYEFDYTYDTGVHDTISSSATLDLLPSGSTSGPGVWHQDASISGHFHEVYTVPDGCGSIKDASASDVYAADSVTVDMSDPDNPLNYAISEGNVELTGSFVGNGPPACDHGTYPYTDRSAGGSSSKLFTATTADTLSGTDKYDVGGGTVTTTWHLTRKDDRDGDGFPDESDDCPDTPATGNSHDGCPDRDGDGFSDQKDACPDDPAPDSKDGCPRPVLSVTRTGADGKAITTGVVTSSPTGIDCGGTCSAAYDLGTAVSLSAQGSPDAPFDHWEGDCTGSGACAVTMNSSHHVTAVFASRCRTVGVVKVCADKFEPTDGQVRASGHVTLQDGVRSTDPVMLDDVAKTIVSEGETSLEVTDPRGRVHVPVTGKVRIDAHEGQSDEVSGREALARIEATTNFLGGALEIAGVHMIETIGGAGIYLDGDDGGGFVFSAAPDLDLFHLKPKGSFAMGVHAAADLRVLGGSVGWDDIGFGTDLFGPWGIKKVILSYQGSPADTFTIEGGVYFGFLSENDSLSGKAVLHAGKIDTLDVTYGTKILLGETGFVLNSINGSVSGLADDAKGMTFEAGVTGSWGPEFHGHALLNIDDVSLAVDLLDKATVNGAVSILDKRLIAGTASLESSNIVTHDFRMAGAASLKIDLAAVQANLGFSDVMTSQHFTMIGEGSGTILGKTIGAVRGVASDKGMGAAGSYHLCAFHHCKNILLGYGMDWDWPPVPHWIGSDVDQFVTVSRAGAAASEERARVSAGQPLFVATAIGTSAAPELELVSPRGQVLNTRKKAAKLYVDRQPATNTTVAVVTAPQVGTWRVRPVSGGATRIMADGLDAVERVRVLSRLPHTSKARPLVRKRTRSLLVRWTSRNWPRRTRLTLYASPDGKTLGKAVKRGLPAVGHRGVPTKLLPKGASHLLLAVADAGRTVDLVPVARAPIWVR